MCALKGESGRFCSLLPVRTRKSTKRHKALRRVTLRACQEPVEF